MQDDFEMTRGKEVILGVLLMLAGLTMFLSNWYKALSEGLFRHGAAIMAPLVFVLGLMMIVAPYPYENQPFDTENAPRSWNAFISAGVALGFANWFLMNFG